MRGTLTTGADDVASMLVDLLLDPDGFFRRRADEPSVRGPAAVVALLVGLRLVGSLPTIRATTAALPEQVGGLGAVIAASSALGAVIGALVAWVLYAGAFHVISAVVFGASGGFKETFALTGWGFVPRLPEAVISGAITYVVFADVTVPADPVQAAAFLRQLRNDPYLMLASVLSMAFLLWSAFLWTFAMRHGRDLTLKQAALTVAAPVGVGVATNLLGLLGFV